MGRKRKPSHSLRAIKQAVRLGNDFDFRRRPIEDARNLGCGIPEMCELISRLTSGNFKKTMPSNDFPNEKIDVYTIDDDGFELYIEFSKWPGGTFKLIAFHLK